MLHVGIVIDHNLIAEPAKDARGRPYPASYIYVRKLWQATPTNPDPVTAHPIPVFSNRQHKDGNQDWEPLPIGTRVLVAEVDKSPINREGFAVIAFGPQTDEPFPDTRETAHYSNYRGGSVDKVVLAPSDPVTGGNEDYGREHRDGDGMGWTTKRPYDDDPMRREAEFSIPGVKIKFDHRIDESTCNIEIEVAGPAVTYNWKLDGVTGTASLVDDQKNSILLNSLAGTLTIDTEAATTVNAKGGVELNALEESDVNINAKGDVNVNADGNVNLAGGGPAVIRDTDTATVTIASGPAAGTHTATFNSASAKVFAG